MAWFLDPLALSCVVSHPYSASSVFLCQSFPQMFAGRVRAGTHDMQNGQKINQSSTLSSTAHVWCTHVHWAAMFGHRTSDFTSGSLNMLQASQTVCKRSAANVPIFMGKHVILAFFQTLFTTSKSHVGTCFLEFWAIFALLIIHILWVVLKIFLLSIATVRARTSIVHAQCQIKTRIFHAQHQFPRCVWPNC